MPLRVDHRRLADQRAEALDRGDLVAAIRLDRPAQMKRGPAATHAPPEASKRAAVYAAAEAERLEAVALAERDAGLLEELDIEVDPPEARSPHENHAALRVIRSRLEALATAPPVEVPVPPPVELRPEPVRPGRAPDLPRPPPPVYAVPPGIVTEPSRPQLIDPALPTPAASPPSVRIPPEPLQRYAPIARPAVIEPPRGRDQAPAAKAVEPTAAAPSIDMMLRQMAQDEADAEREDAEIREKMGLSGGRRKPRTPRTPRPPVAEPKPPRPPRDQAAAPTTPKPTPPPTPTPRGRDAPTAAPDPYNPINRDPDRGGGGADDSAPGGAQRQPTEPDQGLKR